VVLSLSKEKNKKEAGAVKPGEGGLHQKSLQADCALAATVKNRAKRTTPCATLNAAVSTRRWSIAADPYNTAFERPVAYDRDITSHWLCAEQHP
jgi:hypothetical protein